MSSDTCARRVSSRGFTLIELLAVMLIIGMLAGGVTLSLGDHFRNAKLTRAANQIESLDRTVRRQAQRRSQAITLQFNASKNTIRCSDDDLPRITRLPKIVQIQEMITHSGPAGTSSGGQTTVRFEASGQTASYALKLQAADSSEASRWVVALGRSGQILQVASRAEAFRLVGGK